MCSVSFVSSCPPPIVLTPRKAIENVLRREHTKSERRRSNLRRQQEDLFSKQYPFTPTLFPSPSFGTPGRGGRGRNGPRYSNEIAVDQAAEEEAEGGEAGLGDEQAKAEAAAAVAGAGEH